jgi:hypothetical protein
MDRDIVARAAEISDPISVTVVPAFRTRLAPRSIG